MEILRPDYTIERKINGKKYKARPILLKDDFEVTELVEREEQVAGRKFSDELRRRKENIYFIIQTVMVEKKREDGSIYWDRITLDYLNSITWVEIQQIIKLMNEVNSLPEVKKK